MRLNLAWSSQRSSPPVLSQFPVFFENRHIAGHASALRSLVAQSVSAADYPLAQSVHHNIVTYSGSDVRSALQLHAYDKELAFRNEFTSCLRDGPGVLVVKQAQPNHTLLDDTLALYLTRMAEEGKSNRRRSDHFGGSERLWNSLEALCEDSPSNFVDYFGSPVLALACRAWLGPAYQMTAQVNSIKPGGKAQLPHRDYHMGLTPSRRVAEYPVHAQLASQYLSLQGAIVHTDVPLEWGPTRFLPFSQHLPAGYVVASTSFPHYVEVKTVFEELYVSLPLHKGDMVFFNPAVIHAGGENQGSADRFLNLLQVSSPMGRCMETVDRRKTLELVYPVLYNRLYNRQHGHMHQDLRWVRDVLRVAGEGYPFPTNLDTITTTPLVAGDLAPETPVELSLRALQNKWSPEYFKEFLKGL